MRYLGVAAFGATVCILTPLIAPHAGPAERAKLFAPATDELVVDGTTVKLSLDRPFVDPGESIHLTLTADKEVQVGVVVVGSSGNEGDRVPDPPRAVTHKFLTLTPDKTGHASKSIALRLENARTNSYRPYGTYKVYVLSKKDGEHLQKLVDRAGPSIPTGEIPEMDTDTQKLFGAIYGIEAARKADPNLPDDPDNKPEYKAGSVAMLEAYTRPVDSAVTLKMPDKITENGKFTATVTFENPHGYAMENLAPKVEVMGMDDAGYLGLGADAVTIEEHEPISLAAHEKKKLTFEVTAPAFAGVLGLRASATCSEYCNNKDRRLAIGTFEAIEVTGGDKPTEMPVATR